MNGGLADCSEIEIKMLSRSFAVAVTLPALATASVNVVLPCMQNYSLAVTPELASSPPACSWSDYDAFVTDAGVGWSDDATQRVQIGSDGKTNALSEALLTSSLTTALTIVEILRTTLGADYASRTAPVTIDVIGWAFHWTERAEVEGTSNTVEVSVWDTELQRDTRRFWGARIGGALRRMLPLVESVTVRGYGPEAPRVERTPLRDDGWLSLELYPGVYDRLSEPAPTLTLLENSGMHDDLWPSDGGCVSDKGELDVMSKAELEGRKAAGNTEGVGLGCMWRDTIELLRDSGRLVHATSYSSHEHMLAVENLRAIGADIVEAYPNGFREEGNRVLHMDLLRQEGNPLAESLHDPWPRAWGSKEAQYATTTSIWRHRIETLGYENPVRASRNSHVLCFRGLSTPSAAADEAALARQKYDQLWYATNKASAVRARLQEQALAASQLPSMPPRQKEILWQVPWLKAGGEAARPSASGSKGSTEADAPRRSADAEARHDRATELLERGDAAAARAEYKAALRLSPSDAESYVGLANALGELGEEAAKVDALRASLRLRPGDGLVWSKLGVSLSALDGHEDEAEAAFRESASLAPDDARSPLNLGRYLAKLSKPAEAIAQFYAAAGIDAEYFEEAKLGVGTARAQQGRLREAISNFEAAVRINPTNNKVRESIGPMTANAQAVETALGGTSDAVADLCGTPCQDVVDGSGYTVCGITWEDGCGELPPPPGFTAQSTVAQLCARACGFYSWALVQQASGR